MTLQPFNFTSPGRVPSGLEKALVQWLQGACARLPGKWGRQLPFRVEVCLRGPDVMRRDEALDYLPDNVIGYHVALASEALPTLLVFPCALALTLINGLLGEAEGALAEDRELTSVEESLLEFLLNDFLLPSLQEAWPGETEERVELRQIERHPKWTRILPPDEDVLIGELCFQGPFGEQVGRWILPKQRLLAILAPSALEEPANAEEDLYPILEAHVREMRVPVSVSLGQVELPLAQLAALEAGDVVVFNQRIADTLTGYVAGKKKFRVWCGQVGARQAFQVESLIES